MHQSMHPCEPWADHHYGHSLPQPSQHLAQGTTTTTAYVPISSQDGDYRQYMNHHHHHHSCYGYEYPGYHPNTPHQPQQAVVTPHRVSRLVQPDELYRQGYDDMIHRPSCKNLHGRPMVSPPMKIRYIRPPNYQPVCSSNQDDRPVWYNPHDTAYPERRYSEDTSLSSQISQRSTENAVVKMRKVSVGSDVVSSAMKADAKLLLDATAAFHREVPSNVTESNCPFAEKINGCEFVSLDLYGSVPDSLFLSMAQMKICRLNEEDRFGNYKHRRLGVVGMACKHCGGLSGFGRHFPSSFQSLLSGSHCVRIVKHVRSECRACPSDIRQLLLHVDQPKDQASFDHGSRKRFVAYVWARLQSSSGGHMLTDERPASPDSYEDLDESCHGVMAQLLDDDDIPWESILQHSELVGAKDRHLVPDSTFFAISQMKSFPLGEDDRIGRHKDQALGFVGMCCIHCGGKAGKPRYGRFFPSCLKTLAKPASCDRVANHLSNECPSCPKDIKIILHKLQMRELSESNRYGSRNIFFQRLWNRLHKDGDDGSGEDVVFAEKTPLSGNSRVVDLTGEQWNILLDGSKLVSSEDIGLVSDSQLASMAQLSPCQVKAEDRFGWYKDRKVGFGGLACRHCGGRKGAARYFPNALRTFSQNNYCQIVGNHIARDCPACPDEIRTLLAKMLDSDCGKNMGTLSRCASYVKGSRKSFYERIWMQIHNGQKGKLLTGNCESTLLAYQSESSLEEDRSSVIVKKRKKRQFHQV